MEVIVIQCFLLYKFTSISITIGMRPILHDIPDYLITLVEALRVKLRDPIILARHRVRPEDFPRNRQLTFPVLMLFILQKTVKFIQRHWHEFLDDLAHGEIFEPVSSGAVTHARAKLKDTAFSELNRDCVLPTVYGSERPIQRWRDHRRFGVDSALVRLPDSAALWATRLAGKNPPIKTGPPAHAIQRAVWRSSTICPIESATLCDWKRAPSAQWLWPCNSWRPCSREILRSMIAVSAGTFISPGSCSGRCWTGSFLAAQEMFRLNRANQSQGVWLFAPADQKAECRRLGRPLKMKVRFVRVRLPTGELEVLTTLLLAEAR